MTCLAVGLVLVSCGQPSGQSEAPASSTASTSIPDTGSTSELATTTTSAPAVGQRSEPTVIAWIRDFGPLGGASGEGDAVLSAIVTGDCDLALRIVDGVVEIGGEIGEPYRTLYGGTASACVAALHNRPSAWPRARAALAAVRPLSHQWNCLDRLVYDLLDRLVELYRRAPNTRVVMGGSGNVVSPVCPRILALIPDHGSVEGGYPVQIVGEHLPQTVVIHFGEHSITVDTTDRNHAVVTAPPGDPAGGDGRQVSVWPEGWPFEGMHSVGFTYDVPEPAPADTPSVSPTSG